MDSLESLRFVEDHIQPNKFKLDVECEINPTLTETANDELADAIAKRDRIKNELAILKANQLIFIVDRATAGNHKKPTDKVLDAMVAGSQDVIDLEEELVGAIKEVNLWSSKVKAIDDRRSQMKNLTQLWIGGYYSIPGQSEDDIDLMAKQQEVMNKRKRSNK